MMSRILSIGFAWAVLLAYATQAPAEEPQDRAANWMKYLEGKWSYEISDGVQGKAVWTFDAGGKAMIGRFVEGDVNGAEIAGWQPDVEKGVVNGFDSTGNYWYIEYDKFWDGGGVGTIRGVNEGTTYSGSFEAEILNENRWQWTIVAKTSEGESLKLSAQFKRAGEHKLSEEQARDWLKFFVGDWQREREFWRGDEKTVDTASWHGKLAADGRALVSHGKWNQSGESWVMVSGWSPETFQFERGVTSDGINWSIDFKQVDATTIKGKATGFAEGQRVEGYVSLIRTSDNSYEAHVSLKMENGEVRKAKAINKRVKPLP